MLKVRERGGVLYVWGKHKGVQVRKSTGLRVGQEELAERAVQAEVARIEAGEADGGSWVQGERPPLDVGRVETPTTDVWRRVAEWTVADLVGVYLDTADHERAASTLRTLRRIVGVIGRWRVGRLDEDGVAEFVRRRFGRSKVGRASVGRELSALRAVLNFGANGSRGSWRAPRIVAATTYEERQTFLTEAEVGRVLGVVKERRPGLYGVYLALVYSGARPVELARLVWGRDVVLDDDDAKCLMTLRSRKGKGGRWRSRTLPVHPRVAAVLRETDVADRRGPVFRRRDGGGWATGTTPAFMAVWREMAEAAGLPATVRGYDLRHTFASWLLERGFQLDEVRRLLGHSSLQTTLRYAHRSQERLTQAVHSL